MTAPREPIVPAGQLRVTGAPNLIRAEGVLRFSLPSDARVSLRLFDASGRCVRQLLDRDPRKAGPHAIGLNARGLAAGLYLARVDTDDGSATGKVVVIP